METVTIYGRTSCGFCTGARRLCETRGLEYEWVDMVSQGLDKDDLSEIAGVAVHTVPQIFVGQRHVGGFDEFSQYLEQNQA